MRIINWLSKKFAKDNEQDLMPVVDNLRAKASLALDHDNTQLADKVDEIDTFLDGLSEAVSAMRTQTKRYFRKIPTLAV